MGMEELYFYAIEVFLGVGVGVPFGGSGGVNFDEYENTFNFKHQRKSSSKNFYDTYD
jgi:hypothetical protein